MKPAFGRAVLARSTLRRAAMTIERPAEVCCPKCEHEQTVTLWDSLNADVSPEAREDLFEGKINTFECASCASRVFVPIPLLYHDMRRRFCVQYFPFQALEEKSFLDRFDNDGSDLIPFEAVARIKKPSYPAAMAYLRSPHVVFDMGELVRYVLFRERLHEARRRVDQLRLKSPHFRPREGPSVRDLYKAFRRLERAPLDDDCFLILEEGTPELVAFIQTMREEDGYRVEARDAACGRHYWKGRNVSQDEAIALFAAFLRAGFAVSEGDWEDITDEVDRQIRQSAKEEAEDDPSPNYSDPAPQGSRPAAASPSVTQHRPGPAAEAHHPLTPTWGRRCNGLSNGLAGGVGNGNREGGTQALAHPAIPL
jgi:hypothetical protein